jgi:hypothetical protein
MNPLQCHNDYIAKDYLVFATLSKCIFKCVHLHKWQLRLLPTLIDLEDKYKRVEWARDNPSGIALCQTVGITTLVTYSTCNKQ